MDTAQCLAISFALAVLTPCFKQNSMLRQAVFSLHILILAQGYVAQQPSGIDNVSALYTQGVLLANLTGRYFDRLYTTVPEHSYHKLNGNDRSQGRPSSMHFWRKLLWSFELLAVTRGIGWNWEVRGIPRAKTATRRQFVVKQLILWIVMYTGLWLVSASSRCVLEAFPQLPDHATKQFLVNFTSNAVFLYGFIALGWAVTIYSHFAVMMLPLSIICVGLGVGPEGWQTPEAWPPNFGSFKEAYSIRRFWGYTWHQQMRRINGAPGTLLLANMPKAFQSSKALAPRLLRRYILVMCSFLVSGLIHASGSYSVTRLTGLPLSDGGEIRYFLLQGWAIIVEDWVCWSFDINTTRPPSTSRRAIGYVITAMWYVWTRVAWKCVPIALALGFHDERGDLFAAVKFMRLGADAVPGNFVSPLVNAWAS